MDEHQTDYSQITDDIFIGSDMCKGFVCPEHCDEFTKLGINAEINLEVERVEIPTPCVEAYLWLPTEDRKSPSLSQLFTGSAFINESVTQGRKVYVHCKKGHGRSPTMVAAYLIRFEGKSSEEAISLIKGKRPEIHLEEEQTQVLKEFEKKC